MKNVLIGAGGHAKVVYEISKQNGVMFDGFIDPLVIQFKELKKMQEDDSFEFYFLGVGGITINQLDNRHSLYENYKRKKYIALKLISKGACVSESAVIGNGVLISHSVVIQADTIVGENVIINTGAIIEHDVIIEDGVHIAPGAIILGGARIGSGSMIGTGAVVLPRQKVPSKTLVSSLTRYKND